jgi:TIR domain
MWRHVRQHPRSGGGARPPARWTLAMDVVPRRDGRCPPPRLTLSPTFDASSALGAAPWAVSPSRSRGIVERKPCGTASAVPAGMKTTKIFLCHDLADAVSCGKLMNNLRPAQENQLLTLWSSHHAAPGEDVPRYVAANLEDTDLVLLLLSPDLFSHDYFYSTELSAVLERHRAGRARLVPVVLRSCTWEEYLPTLGLQPVPTDEQPLMASSPEVTDHRVAEAAREILALVRNMQSERRRPATRVTPISEINANLKKLREEAAADPDGNLYDLMELKQRLRYGEADRKDPCKPTRQMPSPQLSHLLAASQQELHAGAPDGSP